MLNTLAIDTSTDVTYVTLALADGRRYSLTSQTGNHDATLAGLVKAVFQKLAVTYEVVQQVLIGAGPGSFTGLRIGFSFAEGFAQALKLEAKAIVSLRAYAKEYQNYKVVVTLADARRQEYFFAAYAEGKNELVAPTIYNAEALQDFLQKTLASGVNKDEILLVYTGELELPVEYKSVQAKDLTDSLVELSLDNENICSVAEPLYIRKVAAKTIAERALEAKNRS